MATFFGNEVCFIGWELMAQRWKALRTSRGVTFHGVASWVVFGTVDGARGGFWSLACLDWQCDGGVRGLVLVGRFEKKTLASIFHSSPIWSKRSASWNASLLGSTRCASVLIELGFVDAAGARVSWRVAVANQTYLVSRRRFGRKVVSETRGINLLNLSSSFWHAEFSNGRWMGMWRVRFLPRSLYSSTCAKTHRPLIIVAGVLECSVCNLYRLQIGSSWFCRSMKFFIRYFRRKSRVPIGEFSSCHSGLETRAWWCLQSDNETSEVGGELVEALLTFELCEGFGFNAPWGATPWENRLPWGVLDVTLCGDI
jgi:hypothetical protein